VDLAVIIVSHNSAQWLARCLSSVYARSGGLELDVVVVDSGSTDETVDLVRREFRDARVVATENRGFASANNRGLAVVDADAFFGRGRRPRPIDEDPNHMPRRLAAALDVPDLEPVGGRDPFGNRPNQLRQPLRCPPRRPCSCFLLLHLPKN